MATTLLDLIQRIAPLAGPMHEGTAESGSGVAAIVDKTLIEPDDYWKNHYAYIMSADDAAPEGEERVVSDYVQSTGTLSLVPNFTAAVAAGDTYLLTSLRRADIVRAINNAIGRSSQRWGVPTIDTTTITITADTYQYDLPTDLVWLSDVLYRSDTDEPYRSIERGNWQVAGTVGAQVVDLLDISGFAADDHLRLDYVKRLGKLSNDDDTLDIGAPAEPELIAFLVDYSLWYLHNQAAMANVTSGAFREHYTQASNAYKRAEALLDQAPIWRRAGRIHTPSRPSIRG
jgi:hypothetical protein